MTEPELMLSNRLRVARTISATSLGLQVAPHMNASFSKPRRLPGRLIVIGILLFGLGFVIPDEYLPRMAWRPAVLEPAKMLLPRFGMMFLGLTIMTAGLILRVLNASDENYRPPPDKRWQFSLRSLFFVFLFVAIACGFLSYHHQAKRKYEIAREHAKDSGWQLYGETVEVTGAVSGFGLTGPDPLEPLFPFKDTIYQLKIASFSISSEEQLQSLPQFTELTALDVSSIDIGDDFIDQLVHLPKLTRLNLAYTKITDEGCLTLARFPQLEHLNLYHTKVTDKGLEALSNLPNLKKLYIKETLITPETRRDFFKDHPHIKDRYN